MFQNLISTEAELRDFLGEPSELVKRKQLPALDKHGRAFIAQSPFVVIGTSGSDGLCDVSPRGDPAGFVQVLDDTHLLIPDRPGNRRADTLRNIVQTQAIGLLFMIPGIEETFRVNGRAWLTRDPALLTQAQAFGKTPQLAIGVEVLECYFQCAKAFKRSKLWQFEQWPPRQLASLACMLVDQIGPMDMTLHDIERAIEESNTKRLY
ncbi:MAG: pyridoxamine 5'-phosphate oxidase family protein [Anaerolineae bacterium]|nr:pyridoxamine 5'-phosphate oxidase family protein [Anaerolineae bacterium]